jgi:hypothetical protein
VLDQWPIIGRDQEISAIMRSIEGDTSRGVALAGKAGVGKSRLAREAVAAAVAAADSPAAGPGFPAVTAATAAPNPETPETGRGGADGALRRRNNTVSLLNVGRCLSA